MAKSKNFTHHNQNKKAHKNGIHKAKKYKKMSIKGMCPKFLRNLRFSKKWNGKVSTHIDFADGPSRRACRRRPSCLAPHNCG